MILKEIVGTNAPRDELTFEIKIIFFLRDSFDLTNSNINLLIPV